MKMAKTNIQKVNTEIENMVSFGKNDSDESFSEGFKDE